MAGNVNEAFRNLSHAELMEICLLTDPDLMGGGCSGNMLGWSFFLSFP